MKQKKYKDLSDCQREFMCDYDQSNRLIAFVRNARTLNATEIKYSPDDARQIKAADLLGILGVSESAIQGLRRGIHLDRAAKQELTSLLGKPIDFYRCNLGGGFDMTFVEESKESFEPQKKCKLIALYTGFYNLIRSFFKDKDN